MQDPSLQCQWTAEDLERHGRPCRHYWLHLQNQSDVWRSIMTGFPPVAESPTPEVPCQLSHPPPPPPPMHQLNFHCPSSSCPSSTVLLLPLLLSPPPHPPPPPPPPVKVCACCVYCHDEVVLCCQVIQPDLHMVPDGQQQFMAG